MEAGRLDTRIALERPSRTYGPDGGEVVDWERVGEVWATVVPVSGRERLNAPQVMPEEAIRIHIRYRSDVETSWRVLHEGVPWDITGIARYRREGRVEMTCSRVDARP